MLSQNKSKEIPMIAIAILFCQYYIPAAVRLRIPSTHAFSTFHHHSYYYNNYYKGKEYQHQNHISLTNYDKVFISAMDRERRSNGSSRLKIRKKCVFHLCAKSTENNDVNEDGDEEDFLRLALNGRNDNLTDNSSDKANFERSSDTDRDTGRNENTKNDDNSSSRQSILPPYRTTNSSDTTAGTGTTSNTGGTKKWKRGSRLTIRRSFSDNNNNDYKEDKQSNSSSNSSTDKKNNNGNLNEQQPTFSKGNDISSSSSSSILPPFSPSSSSSSSFKTTTIHDFRMRQKQKLHLRNNSNNRSKQNSSINNNTRTRNPRDDTYYSKNKQRNNYDKSPPKPRSSSSSSVLPPPLKGTTTNDNDYEMNENKFHFDSSSSYTKRISRNNNNSNNNNNNSNSNVITSWDEFLSKDDKRNKGNYFNNYNNNNINGKTGINTRKNVRDDNTNFNRESNNYQNARSFRYNNETIIRRRTSATGSSNTSNNISSSTSSDKNNDTEEECQEGDEGCVIPSIEDLPPPSYLFGQKNLSTSARINKNKEIDDDNIPSSLDRVIAKDRNQELTSSSSSLPSLDGVLPVSELFYRSTQSLSDDDDDENDNDDNNNCMQNSEYDDDMDECQTNDNSNNKISSNDSDDEELPFSAEQSDRILTRNNKICLRRNSPSSSEFTTEEDEEGNNVESNQDKAYYKTDLAKFQNSLSSSLSSSNNNNNNSDDYDSKTKDNQKRRRRGGRPSKRLAKKMEANKGRKMVRRGMEMLVGGEPINADPPLRFVELQYCFDRANNLAALGTELALESESTTTADITTQLAELSGGFHADFNKTSAIHNWAGVITTNSRDFGPLLHQPSVEKVSETSRHIYCEHFVNACLRWQVCPRDLKVLVKNHKMNQLNENNKKKMMSDNEGLSSEESYEQLLKYVSDPKSDIRDSTPESKEEKEATSKPEDQTRTAFRGFGKSNTKTKLNDSSVSESKHSFQSFMENDKSNRATRRSKSKDSFTLGGELKFTLGLTRADLESGNDAHILRRVLSKGIATAIRAESLGFNIAIAKLILNENDEGETEFNVAFNMVPKEKMPYEKVEQVAKSVNSELANAMDYGDMALAMGAAAKAEMAWPARVRKRIVEEFLFDDDDDDEPVVDVDQDQLDEDEIDFRQEDMGFQNTNSGSQFDEDDDFDGPFGMPGDTIYANDDIYLGGGNGGVFADYSEDSILSSPWQGKLGPLLVDATVQRALQRQPRVIAIGDVHGCLDELQALLRRCDYRPGDLIVFLGDLVSKGPDSLSVVQMARELGAIGVRGNHDFEVIRWHQAIKSGKSVFLKFP